jgi:hypothetical protein
MPGWLAAEAAPSPTAAPATAQDDERSRAADESSARARPDAAHRPASPIEDTALTAERPGRQPEYMPASAANVQLAGQAHDADASASTPQSGTLDHEHRALTPGTADDPITHSAAQNRPERLLTDPRGAMPMPPVLGTPGRPGPGQGAPAAPSMPPLSKQPLGEPSGTASAALGASQSAARLATRYAPPSWAAAPLQHAQATGQPFSRPPLDVAAQLHAGAAGRQLHDTQDGLSDTQDGLSDASPGTPPAANRSEELGSAAAAAGDTPARLKRFAPAARWLKLGAGKAATFFAGKDGAAADGADSSAERELPKAQALDSGPVMAASRREATTQPSDNEHAPQHAKHATQQQHSGLQQPWQRAAAPAQAASSMVPPQSAADEVAALLGSDFTAHHSARTPEHTGSAVYASAESDTTHANPAHSVLWGPDSTAAAELTFADQQDDSSAPGSAGPATAPLVATAVPAAPQPSTQAPMASSTSASDTKIEPAPGTHHGGSRERPGLAQLPASAEGTPAQDSADPWTAASSMHRASDARSAAAASPQQQAPLSGSGTKPAQSRRSPSASSHIADIAAGSVPASAGMEQVQEPSPHGQQHSPLAASAPGRSAAEWAALAELADADADLDSTAAASVNSTAHQRATCWQGAVLSEQPEELVQRSPGSAEVQSNLHHEEAGGAAGPLSPRQGSAHSSDARVMGAAASNSRVDMLEGPRAAPGYDSKL